MTLKWEFEEYQENSTRQDSSSDKFFKDASESDSLIREFVQNSLDARDCDSKPVKIIINHQSLNNLFKKTFLDPLEPHLRESHILINGQSEKVIVLEDFNTKGLGGDNKEDFFYKDNITSKAEGGGSHGIGKAVFPAVSQIKTFFGYSVFSSSSKENDDRVFQGRAILKTHKIKQIEYRPYGDLEIPVEKHTDIIQKIFKRKISENGLSIAIPYCNIDLKDIKRSCLSQCYWPIANEKLEIEIENDKKFTPETLLEENNPKIELVNNYQTYPKYKIKIVKVEQKAWKKLQFPQLSKEQIDRLQQNQSIFISFEIELPVKKDCPKYGTIRLLIKKKENIQDKTIDVWRDHLLINKALGGSKKESEYSVIVIIEKDPLSQLLRQLEDPGHTKWQTGTISEEVKKEYKHTLIKDLVKFIRKLPMEIIKQMKHRSIDQDESFFADYFPDVSSNENKRVKTKEGIANSSYSEEDIEEVPSFPDFIYKKHKKNDGFTLNLKNKENYPEQITIKTAYGTNIGDAFKNYDKRDFQFGKDIKIQVDNQYGESLKCEDNIVQYKIKNKKFSISLTGFDQHKELKIEVK